MDIMETAGVKCIKSELFLEKSILSANLSGWIFTTKSLTFWRSFQIQDKVMPSYTSLFYFYHSILIFFIKKTFHPKNADDIQ